MSLYSPSDSLEVKKFASMIPNGNIQSGLQNYYGQGGMMPLGQLLSLFRITKDIENQRQAAATQRMLPQTQPGQTTVADDIANGAGLQLAGGEAQLAGLGHQNDGVAGLPIEDEKMFTAAQGGVVAFAEGTKKDGVEAKDEEEDDRPSAARVAVPAAVLAGKAGLDYVNKIGSATHVGAAPYTPTTVGRILKKGIPKGIGFTAGRAGLLGTLGASIYDTASTDTADYYKRFGLEPSEPGAAGGFRDAGIRALGAGSDILNNATFGYLGGKFRDKFDPETGKKIAPPAAAPTPAGVAMPSGYTSDSEGAARLRGVGSPPKDWSAAPAGKGSGSGSGIASLDTPSKYEKMLMDSVNEKPEKLLTVEEQMAERNRLVGKETSIPSKELAAKLDMFNQEAKTLKGSRDFDRWMSFAQGFFAMGAGRSPYAMQNIAEGLGITTKQLSAAEKEYNAAEKERTRAVQAAQDAARAEAIGRVDVAMSMREKAKIAEQASKDRRERMLGTLIGVETSSKDRRAARENAAAMAGATRENTQATKEMTALSNRLSAITQMHAETRKGYDKFMTDAGPRLMSYAKSTDPAKQAEYQSLLKQKLGYEKDLKDLQVHQNNILNPRPQITRVD